MMANVPLERPPAGDDAIEADRGWLRSREWWRASSVPARGLSVAALGLALAALVLGDVALQTHPTRHVRAVFAPAGPGPVTVDSSGCPVRVRCTLSSRSDPKLGAALRRAFPGAEVSSSALVRDAGSGRVYQRVVLARSGSMTLVLSADCIPGNDRGLSRTSVTPLAGSRGRRVLVVAAGADGCSASVQVDLTSASPAAESALVRLARDPAVQLTP